MTTKTETLTTSPKFGTFTGVFLPSVLTIFGVILYLRLGWIVGVAGPWMTVGIISLSSLITLITAFSLSSIATNMRIGSGGVYYILSRTFGIKIGSAIGIPLFLAQALSISFYISGFVETVTGVLPFLSPKVIEIATLSLITTLALISTDIALKSQLIIFGLIIISLFSLAMGRATPISTEIVEIPKISFWPLFALFFPAVTGIEAGISMSGDLKNPARSLPMGTIAAVVVGYISYLLLALFLSSRVSADLLISHPMIMEEIALIKEFILIGIWGATLSSSLSCMLGAPRTLSALAEDGIAPRWMAGRSIRLPIVITALFVMAGLLLGSIDQIAPVLSMFFLISYAMLNLATSFEGILDSPSWRPTFRFPWYISFFGTLLAVAVMLLIDASHSLLAFMSVVAIYFIAARRQTLFELDDLREALLVFFSRLSIYGLARMKKSTKSWRPNLLVFLEDPFSRQSLMELTHDLTHGQGFLIFASILEEQQKAENFKKKMEDYLEKARISGLVETFTSTHLFDGMKSLAQAAGIGPLTPNTIVLGTTRKESRFTEYGKLILTAYREQKNVILVQEGSPFSLKPKQIDVWWGGLNPQNSELMLLFAHMLRTSGKWRGAKLHLKTAIFNEKSREQSLEKLRELSCNGRLPLTPEVILAQGDLFAEAMRKSSSGADLIFLGLRPPLLDETPESYGEYYQKLLTRTEHFPPTAFVLASEPLAFSKILE
ncbi:MAG: hypothetical protein SNF33_07290 [Candidatus Algichlamydia australiensis]|nr:hypothetical protein [Chlamydiales bacterium]